MSKPATEAAPEATVETTTGARAKPRISLDDLTKLFGLLVALIGVGKYFYDKSEAAAHEAQARSIAYIERWGGEPMLGAREALFDFWSAQPDLIRVFGTEALSPRQYRSLLAASLFRQGADSSIRTPLLLLDNFYSQMSFCAQSGLCDRTILDAYFCTTTHKNVVAYMPFYDRIREATGDSSVGTEMAAFAQDCPKG